MDEPESVSNLAKDMLFQLNTALLASMPQPERAECPINPIFYRSGLTVQAIGPTVEIPRDVIPLARQGVQCHGSAKPDLVFADKKSNSFILFECKPSSFSPDSTNSHQARTLLLCSGKLILEVLGKGTRGAASGGVCYLVGDDQGSGMLDTLEELARELNDSSLDSGFCASLILTVDETETKMGFDPETQRRLNLPNPTPTVVLRYQEGFDPRSLYLILFDPSHNNISERNKCLLILRSKILRFLVTQVGGVRAPSTIRVSVEDAMLSLFGLIMETWRDREVIKNTRRQISQFFSTLTNQLKKQEGLVALSGNGEIEFKLTNELDREHMLVALQKADPYVMQPAPEQDTEPLFEL